MLRKMAVFCAFLGGFTGIGMVLADASWSGRSLTFLESSAVQGNGFGWRCKTDDACVATYDCAGFGTECEQGMNDFLQEGNWRKCVFAIWPITYDNCEVSNEGPCVLSASCIIQNGQCIVDPESLIVAQIDSHEDCTLWNN